jgi:hypothetical protein
MKSSFQSRTLATQLTLGLPQLLFQLVWNPHYIACEGGDPRESTFSIVIAQQYFGCCLRICCRGNLVTESLPSNERLLWLRDSGFQASCHTIYRSTNISEELLSPLLRCGLFYPYLISRSVIVLVF